MSDVPMCRHCGRPDNLITGDGPVIVCRSCVRSLGEVAADPNGIREDVLALLQSRHGDVVVLTETARPGRTAWRSWNWIGRP